MWLNQIQNFYEANPDWVIWGATGVFVLMLLFGLWIRYLWKTAEPRKVRKTVKKLASGFLCDIIIPDGVDGFVSIDYLVLTPGGIVVLDIQNYSGVLFGGDRIDLWTQMVKHKSYKFDNPVRKNATRVQAVKALAPDAPVSGRVVFASSGHFPKGVPGGVSMINNLKQDLSHLLTLDEVPASTQAAWEMISANAQEPYKA